MSRRINRCLAVLLSLGLVAQGWGATSKRSYKKPPRGATLYRGHPLARGLIGAWLLNENGGISVYDYARNATATIGGVLAPVWATGPYGPEITTNDSIKNFATENFPTTGFPISIVFITTFINIAAGGDGAILSHDDGTNIGYNIGFSNASPTVMTFLMAGVASNAFSNLSVAVANNNLYYFGAVTVSGNNGTAIGYLGKLGQNLVTQTLTSIGSETGTPTKVQIGNSGGSAAHNGHITYVLFYNRVLSAQEITELNNNPYGMFYQQKPLSLVATAAASVTFNPMNAGASITGGKTSIKGGKTGIW